MQKINVEQIAKELAIYGIVSDSLSLQGNSNNITLTDGKKVFVKILGDTNTVSSFITELEAAKVVTFGPQPLVAELINLSSSPATVWKHLSGSTMSPKLMKAEHAEDVTSAFFNLHRANPESFSNLGTLEQVLVTINRRLKSEMANSLPVSIKKDFDTLIEKVALPVTSARYKNLVLCHSDGHPENFMKLANDKLMLIDYESIKLAPPEYDLAVMYQALMQAHKNPEAWQAILFAFNSISTVDEARLKMLIALRNISTATYAIKFGNWEVVGGRTTAILEGLRLGQPAKDLPAII